MDVLIGRLVKVTKTLEKYPGFPTLGQSFGKLVKIDKARNNPFLVEFIKEDGKVILEWINGWQIDVIR